MGGVFYQLFTAIACSFGNAVMGVLFVWPSYTLQDYTSQNTTVLSRPMNEVESSLVGSLPCLGGMVGTAIISPMMDILGRKRAGIVISLPFMISWLMIELSTSPIVILTARLIAGVAGGGALVLAPIFISEIAEDSIRGRLASGPITFYCLGYLMSYICGYLGSYETIIWTNIGFSAAAVGFFVLVKESPVFLLKMNRVEEAKSALAHYRGTSAGSKVVLEELSRIRQQLAPPEELVVVICEKNEESEKLNAEKLSDEPNKKMSAIKVLLFTPSSRRGFFVVLIVMSHQLLMGMIPVSVYAKDLFAEAVPDLSAHVCSIVFALVLLLGSSFGGAVSDKAGRRLLIISSSILVVLIMSALGILRQTLVAPPWVLAVVILLYCFAFYLGAGSIPYVLMAEVFVPEVQSLASTITIEWVWLLSFFVVFTFPLMKQSIQIYGCFYVFACTALFNAVVSFIWLPETKGLSNQQIQEVFSGKRSRE